MKMYRISRKLYMNKMEISLKRLKNKKKSSNSEDEDYNNHNENVIVEFRR